MGALRSFQPFDPLRDEPRFKAVVVRMQFPQLGIRQRGLNGE